VIRSPAPEPPTALVTSAFCRQHFPADRGRRSMNKPFKLSSLDCLTGPASRLHLRPWSSPTCTTKITQRRPAPVGVRDTRTGGASSRSSSCSSPWPPARCPRASRKTGITSPSLPVVPSIPATRTDPGEGPLSPRDRTGRFRSPANAAFLSARRRSVSTRRSPPRQNRETSGFTPLAARCRTAPRSTTVEARPGRTSGPTSSEEPEL
jgi:hypothetical protein